jgi:hypothetical protein
MTQKFLTITILIAAALQIVAMMILAIAIFDLAAKTLPPDNTQRIVEGYKQGLKDALRTNPASNNLEFACIELWSNKQGVK